MRDLRRVHPPDKEVLRGINISMYPGAKIGVLGLNGSGKSTLLRIMAGEDDGYSGECGSRPASVSATCRRSRSSTRPRTCSATSPTASRTRRACSTASRRCCNAMGEPDADFDKLLGEQAELQDQIDAVNGWDLDRQLEIAMDALRLPPADADVDDALRRRAPAGRAVPAAAVEARPAAARRAHEPPRRRVGRVARAAPARVPRHRRRGHPRPLLPRQRRRLDPRARPRVRHPVGGQLLELARAEGRAARAGGEGRRDRGGARSPASSSGSGWRRRLARRRARRASTRSSSSSRRPKSAERREDQAADLDPARSASRRPRGRGRAPRARATASSC